MARDRVGNERAAETHALEALGHLGVEITLERRRAFGILAFGRNRDAALKVGKEPAFVEVTLRGEDRLRTAHAGSIAIGPWAKPSPSRSGLPCRQRFLLPGRRTT